MTLDFLSMEARRKWHSIFQVLERELSTQNPAPHETVLQERRYSQIKENQETVTSRPTFERSSSYRKERKKFGTLIMKEEQQKEQVHGEI